MSLFEFVAVIISMILALGMGRLLMGVSATVENRREIVGYATHSIWLVSLFLLILHTWWAQWDFRELEWTYPAFVYVVLAPTLLFFAVELITPSHVAGRALDLGEHFRIVRPHFMIVMVALNVFMWLDGPLWLGQEAFGLIGLLHLFFVGFLLLGLSTEREGPNRIAALGVLAVLLLAASIRFLPGSVS
jgi:hypothetical protein